MSEKLFFKRTVLCVMAALMSVLLTANAPAGAQRSTATVESKLHCPQCIQLFDTHPASPRAPIVGSCGHSLCRACMERYVNVVPNNGKCIYPNCNYDGAFTGANPNYTLCDLIPTLLPEDGKKKCPVEDCLRSDVLVVDAELGFKMGLLEKECWDGKSHYSIKIADSHERTLENRIAVENMAKCTNCLLVAMEDRMETERHKIPFDVLKDEFYFKLGMLEQSESWKIEVPWLNENVKNLVALIDNDNSRVPRGMQDMGPREAERIRDYIKHSCNKYKMISTEFETLKRSLTNITQYLGGETEENISYPYQEIPQPSAPGTSGNTRTVSLPQQSGDGQFLEPAIPQARMQDPSRMLATAQGTSFNMQGSIQGQSVAVQSAGKPPPYSIVNSHADPSNPPTLMHPQTLMHPPTLMRAEQARGCPAPIQQAGPSMPACASAGGTTQPMPLKPRTGSKRRTSDQQEPSSSSYTQEYEQGTGAPKRLSNPPTYESITNRPVVMPVKFNTWSAAPIYSPQPQNVNGLGEPPRLAPNANIHHPPAGPPVYQHHPPVGPPVYQHHPPDRLQIYQPPQNTPLFGMMAMQSPSAQTQNSQLPSAHASPASSTHTPYKTPALVRAPMGGFEEASKKDISESLKREFTGASSNDFQSAPVQQVPRGPPKRHAHPIINSGMSMAEEINEFAKMSAAQQIKHLQTSLDRLQKEAKSGSLGPMPSFVQTRKEAKSGSLGPMPSFVQTRSQMKQSLSSGVSDLQDPCSSNSIGASQLSNEIENLNMDEASGQSAHSAFPCQLADATSPAMLPALQSPVFLPSLDANSLPLQVAHQPPFPCQAPSGSTYTFQPSLGNLGSGVPLLSMYENTIKSRLMQMPCTTSSNSPGQASSAYSSTPDQTSPGLKLISTKIEDRFPIPTMGPRYWWAQIASTCLRSC